MIKNFLKYIYWKYIYRNLMKHKSPSLNIFWSLLGISCGISIVMNYKKVVSNFIMLIALFTFLYISTGCKTSPPPTQVEVAETGQRPPINSEPGAWGEGYGPIVIHYGLNDSHGNSWVQRTAQDVIGIVFGRGIAVGDISNTGDLIYKTIQTDGSETEEVVTTGSGVNKSVLLYDAGSFPHIFYARSTNSDQFIYHFYKNGGPDWLEETVLNFANEGGMYIYELSAVIGKNNVIHLLVLKSRSNPDSRDWNWAYLDSNLYYITNGSGNWEKQLIHGYDTFYTYDVDLKTLRRQDIAVDNDGYAHVVFGEQLNTLVNDRDSTGRLLYATNKPGGWVIEVALDAQVAPHEAGWSPSLCLDKTGRPVVASTYVARVMSRSVSYTQLYYSVRLDSGQWETTIVADRDDGYYGTDGRRYTGALPHLKIDSANRPHIVFSDIASSHGPTNYLNIGQIRYAVFNGTSWDISTIYLQPRPQSFFEAREMGGQCLAISGDREKIQVVGQELITTAKGVYTYQLVHFVIK